MAIIKQAADLHASALSQSIVECYLGLGRLPAQIDKIRAAYKPKGEILAGLVEQELGDYITFDKPKGGMFLWARFRQPFNATEWLNATLQQGVVFVPEYSSPQPDLRPSPSSHPTDAMRSGPLPSLSSPPSPPHQTAIFTSPCCHVAVIKQLFFCHSSMSCYPPSSFEPQRWWLPDCPPVT